jgi:hypothetical protein
MSFCNFDFSDNTQKYGGEEQYGVGIDLYYFDECYAGEKGVLICTEKIKTLQDFGREDFFEFCGSEGEKIPECSRKDVYVLNEEDNNFLDKDEKILLRVYSAIGKVPE